MRRSRGSANQRYAVSTTAGSSSTTVTCTSPKSRQTRFGADAPAEADHEDPLRVGVVREPELEVVRVREPRPERLADVHPALERAVEAEVARPFAVDDDEPVVLRVARLANGEARPDRLRDLRRVELPRRAGVPLAVERRPVLRGEALEALAGRVGRERADRERGGSSAGDEDGGRDPHALDERDPGGSREQHDRADREHLVRAVLGDEPERGREGPGDAAGGREREQPPGGPAETVERARREADGDRRDGGEDDAHRAEQRDRRDERVEARPRVPADHAFEHPLVDERDREHEHRPERDRADEQVGRRPPVGDGPTDRIAEGEAGEHDPDQGAPDVERAAERRREHPARGDLDAEQHRSREEHRDGDRQTCERGPAALHRSRVDAIHTQPRAAAAGRPRRRARGSGSRGSGRSAPRADSRPAQRGRGRSPSPETTSHRAPRARSAVRLRLGSKGRPGPGSSSRITCRPARGSVDGSAAIVSSRGTVRSIHAAASRRRSRPVSAVVSPTDHQSGTRHATSAAAASGRVAPASTQAMGTSGST